MDPFNLKPSPRMKKYKAPNKQKVDSGSTCVHNTGLTGRSVG